VRGDWEGFRAALVSTITTLEAGRDFRKRRMREAVLSRFEDPAALVSYLTSPGGDVDEKEQIYRVLVTAVQTRAAWPDLATSILWLGLWPALDRIYRRRLCHFPHKTGELVGGIGLSFTAAVGRADLRRIHRVAATLTMNTERDLMASVRRGWDQSANEKPYEDGCLEDAANEAQRRAGGGGPPPASEQFALAELRARVLPIVGEDTDLLLDVAILGSSQREAADRLGIPYGTVRKRYQRARARARDFFRTPVPLRPPNLRFPR
jgi:RNA polymerase sigma-70 factor (ECF subfamily)